MAPEKAENRIDTMTTKQTLMLAMTGAALVAGSQAQAQSFNDELFLDFRDVSHTADDNATIDLGNVNTFVSTLAALPGATAALDTVGGVNLTPGYTATFANTALIGSGSLYGTPASNNKIGFSAGAGNGSTDTLYLTRQISAPNLTGTGLTQSAQQGSTAQNSTYLALRGIGLGTQSLSASQLAGSQPNAYDVPSGISQSYQKEGQGVGLPAIISYGGSQSTASGAGGLLEGQLSTATIYEALWQVPSTDNGGNGVNDVYEGYFTFKPSGEVDFTTTPSVPEPATYAFVAGLGLLALAARRQFRALVA
jgi:hypothetical protein